MSRSLSLWLLASALTLSLFVGCGGGAATDSGGVAENSGGAAPASGGGSSMMPSGGMQSPDSGEMGDEMSGEMYGDTGDPAADMAMGMDMDMDMDMDMEGMSPDAAGYAGAEGYAGSEGNPGGERAGAPDMEAMEGAYGEAGYPGAPDGTSPEEMADGAYPGAGAEGADPGDEYAGGPDGAGAYPGGEYPGGPGGAVEEKIPDGFDGKAQWSFRRGREKDAIQYLYAHALTTDAGAESLLPTIRWVGGLKQPMLAVRWGVGFVVTAPRNFNGDPKPVGSTQQIPTRDGNRNRDDGGGNEGYVGGGGEDEYGAGDGGGGGGGGKNSLLSKKAGELGEKLTAAYTERLVRGDFGEVLKIAMEAGSAGSRPSAGGAGAYGYGGEGEGDGADYSSGPQGFGGPGGPGGPAAGAAAETEVTQIMTGLSMLGIGTTQKELIDRAREDGIDAVVIIDMKLRVIPANGLVTNESTIALLDAKTQKKLHTTKKFNNITIQKARAESKEDGVDKEFAALFEAIDANFKMTALPAGLTADIAARRVAALTAGEHDNLLPVLVEARMYHSKGLLGESQLFAAYEQLLGVDFGRLLATGEEEDKKKVLSQWLPES